ncbi:DUF87 domain-containing protein [Segetibacter sp. 3557_3]|uniref:ATP-binding protein n=1 Tax=Segetibacter sp. 3557_3 TaxID=2547429 RepID=UPI001058F67C|nr:DUF87 domain-containing protein [Segetibacter sp. 3557_3]TDH26786.1 DUF87 domain-containing protein [Segetibacter sp. 3557_3]
MNQLHDFDQLRNLTIGMVDYVSPVEIRVLLEPDAPQNTALNNGVPSLFPRINGYVLIPNEIGAVVGVISWIGTEHSSYPKRKGFKDYDLIDLPFPTRKMMINPVGTLKTIVSDSESFHRLERGVYSFPSVGDTVILPKHEQLRAIVENSDKGAFVRIGTAPIAGDATVTINPDRLFGRHVAVLGNTGSGKSCSAAGLIRWSLEEAEKHKAGIGNLNGRFVILDPNGEYCDCFSDLNITVKRFKIEISEREAGIFKSLKVPGWLWNSFEWSSFSQASAKTQKPILRRALRELRNGSKTDTDTTALQYNRYVKSCVISLKSDLRTGSRAFSEWPGKNDFGKKLRAYKDSLLAFIGRVDEQLRNQIEQAASNLDAIAQSRYAPFNNGQINYEPFTVAQVYSTIETVETLLSDTTPNIEATDIDEDSPVPFDPELLPQHVETLSEEQGVLQHLDFLILRIKTLLADKRMKKVVGRDDDVTLENWLNDYLTGITIIDLSLIPSDVVHLIVSVISRIIFEAVQRYRRRNEKVLPTVLMLEEAHNFIKKTFSAPEELSTSEVCSQTFEKIAKEGRKFGLSLLISSQRPSELSDTVLSQCNTFLLHRIVNDRDQDLVKRLVPDNIGGLLKELPVLPTQKAILLGWASPLPMLVQLRSLTKSQRPKSQDPDFWDVWTGKEERTANWTEIVTDWTGEAQSADNVQTETATSSETSSSTDEDNLPF